MNNVWKGAAWTLFLWVVFGKSHPHVFIFLLCVLGVFALISLAVGFWMNIAVEQAKFEQDVHAQTERAYTEAYARIDEILKKSYAQNQEAYERASRAYANLHEHERRHQERYREQPLPRKAQPVFNSPVERKIHALLELADRPGTPEEGIAARAQAHKLAEKHGITL